MYTVQYVYMYRIGQHISTVKDLLHLPVRYETTPFVRFVCCGQLKFSKASLGSDHVPRGLPKKRISWSTKIMIMHLLINNDNASIIIMVE